MQCPTGGHKFHGHELQRMAAIPLDGAGIGPRHRMICGFSVAGVARVRTEKAVWQQAGSRSASQTPLTANAPIAEG
jgi:hypothetical protein